MTSRLDIKHDTHFVHTCQIRGLQERDENRLAALEKNGASHGGGRPKASDGLRSVNKEKPSSAKAVILRFCLSTKDETARDSAQEKGQRSNQLNYVLNRGINNLQ
jgi:hypothetical protein